MDPIESWSIVEDAARALRVKAGSAPELVEALVAEAVRVVPGADDVGVIVAGRTARLRVVATSGPVVDALDALQSELDAGPCLASAREQDVVHVPDLTVGGRWPAFARAAVEAGVASMMCLPMHVDDRILGTLTCYSRAPRAFDGAGEAVARLLATLAALALADAQRILNLERALENRDVIGQAKGVLMTVRGITADSAFELLARHSQDRNVKLAAVAAHVAETGALPD